MKILLVGPLPPPMGGATRHFLTLKDDLDSSDEFDVRVLNTSRAERSRSRLSNALVGVKTIAGLARQLPWADVVSYHASDRGMMVFGPVVYALARTLRVPVIFRMFGGSFGDRFERSAPWRRKLIQRTVLRGDAVLLQTKRMIGQLGPFARAPLTWFSTYIHVSERPSQAPPIAERERCLKYIYLGHMWERKGIESLLAVARELPEGASIDLYGTLDEYTEEDINGRGGGRVVYRGFLSHAEVDATLWRYDCLILPTHHHGEGYPGVIAEAFAHGLPVITTRWLAIPEIVDETCGLLIEPKNPQQLAKAVATLTGDPVLWQRLAEGAANRAEQFRHDRWARVFEELCRSVAGAKQPR